jgi:hypothetical protein
LTFDNVAFLVIEPPDINYPWLKAGAITIDTGDGQPTRVQARSRSHRRAPGRTWMYLGVLNRFLLLSGGNASLEWTGPEEDRT